MVCLVCRVDFFMIFYQLIRHGVMMGQAMLVEHKVAQTNKTYHNMQIDTAETSQFPYGYSMVRRYHGSEPTH